MKTIDLYNCKAKNIAELYALVVKEPAFRYRVLIPRINETGITDEHFINSMEFGCAAWAGHHLHLLSTDFSYTVPSPYRKDPFCFLIEAVEPKELTAVIFVLLNMYNRNFTKECHAQFHFEAAQYFRRVCNDKTMTVAAPGLIAVAKEQLELSLDRFVAADDRRCLRRCTQKYI